MELTVKELANRLGAELIGDGADVIRSVGPVGYADQATLTFLADEKHLAELKKSRCGAAIVNKAIEGFSQPQLLVKNVNAALIDALKIFAPKLRPAVPAWTRPPRLPPASKWVKTCRLVLLRLSRTALKLATIRLSPQAAKSARTQKSVGPPGSTATLLFITTAQSEIML